ncbi:MAG: SpoIIE family protein phosphatase [Pseudomonadales bacterium]|nr:SpoIIE family protein phosphatase [Pseudomonadales bacterium]
MKQNSIAPVGTQPSDLSPTLSQIDVESDEVLRILIADDNDSDRLILQTIVKKQGHTVFAAADGEQAVRLFEEERPDIVLLDALMPVMDGFEAARMIKKLAGEDLVPIIFLTSLKDAASLADCLDAGGSDFLNKPYNRVILQAKIQAFNRMRKLHATVRAQRDEISRHHDHLIHEQEVAKAVFDNIAHPGCIDAKNIKYLLSPMAVFNGDLALAARRPSGGMVVLLGDFTGHGLPAAIGAMPLSDIFYGMIQKGFLMQEILREINKKLKSILPVGVFCCACMVDMSFRKGLMEIWVGGLPDIFLYRAESATIAEIKSSNLPLGVLGDAKFNTDAAVYELSLGDRVYLWSDGIHEEVNSEDVMFGTSALSQVFEDNKNPDQLFDDILGGVLQFTGGTEQEDDHTLVEVTMMSAEEMEGVQELEEARSSSAYLGGPQDWKLTYELLPDSLRSFNPLPLLTHILMEVPGLRPHSGKLYTIMAELYSNALEHGLLGLDSNLKSSPLGFADYYRERTDALEKLTTGKVCIYLIHNPEPSGGVLSIKIEDSGDGFNFDDFEKNQHKTEGYCGRGIPLIRSMCQSFNYYGNGNIVEAVFAWSVC